MFEKEAEEYIEKNCDKWEIESLTVDEIVRLAIIGFATEATKELSNRLEAQKENLINEIDKTMVLSNMRECEICDIQDIFRKNGFKRNEGKWELAE